MNPIERLIARIEPIWETAMKQRDFKTYEAAYGIGYAVVTCRVSAEMGRAILDLSDAALTILIDRIAGECSVSGDVPYWLNRHYTEIVK